MMKKSSIIENIYCSDLMSFNDNEQKEIDELEADFLKDENLNPEGALGVAISNFALDYSSICRRYGFKEGFCCAMHLISEVLGNE